MKSSMRLRRTAVLVSGLGLALTAVATPAAAHEGHEGREKTSPGHNKDIIPLQCDGIGAVTVEVTSAGEGRGVGRIVDGGKGVLIPTVAVFEVRNDTTEQVITTETEEFAPGQRDMATTTCTAIFFTGTLAEVAAFDPDFAAFLQEAGARPTDTITAETTVRALLRGQIGRR